MVFDKITAIIIGIAFGSLLCVVEYQGRVIQHQRKYVILSAIDNAKLMQCDAELKHYKRPPVPPAPPAPPLPKTQAKPIPDSPPIEGLLWRWKI